MQETYFVDIHAHIVPNVDDGAQTVEEAVKIAEAAYLSGTRTIIATPHYYTAEDAQNEIEKNFRELSEILHKKLPELEIYLGSENYFHQQLAEEVKSGLSRTLAGSECVLVEFSIDARADFIFKSLLSLFSSGYEPILAHAERYANLSDENIENIYDLGAHIQINASAITAGEFKRRRKVKRWLKNGFVDFVSSDCHSVASRPPQLTDAYEKVVKMCGSEYADMVFRVNAENLILTKNGQRSI